MAAGRNTRRAAFIVCYLDSLGSRVLYVGIAAEWGNSEAA